MKNRGEPRYLRKAEKQRWTQVLTKDRKTEVNPGAYERQKNRDEPRCLRKAVPVSYKITTWWYDLHYSSNEIPYRSARIIKSKINSSDHQIQNQLRSKTNNVDMFLLTTIQKHKYIFSHIYNHPFWYNKTIAHKLY